MTIKTTEVELCKNCKEEITIHEYEGLEGAGYTSHNCGFMYPINKQKEPAT